MVAPALRPLTLGEILDVSFSLYRAHFATFFVVAATVQAIPIAAELFRGGDPFDPSQLALSFAVLLVNFIMSAIGVAACTLVVSRAYFGERVSAGEALRGAMPFIGRMAAISAMTVLIITGGLVLLIVPGIIALTGLAVSSVAAVVEAPLSPGDALRRSWALTKGFRWRMLWVFLVPMVLLLMVPGIVLGGLLAAVGLSPEGLAFRTLLSVLTVFFYPFLYIVFAISYFDLRVRKEGFDLELMAAGAPPA